MEKVQDLVIDRAHRLVKHKFLHASVLRDVIARIYFFQIKDRATVVALKMWKIPETFTYISLFADLLAQPTTEIGWTNRSLKGITFFL